MAKFKAGVSGNKAGRPPGIKDKRSELRALIEPHAGALIQKAVDLALGGDTNALRLCMERLVPPIRAQTESVTLALSGTLAERAEAVVEAAATGTISPDAASVLMNLLAQVARVEEASELKKEILEIKAILAAAGHPVK